MFLGIDLGTSELKALLLDERGAIVATAGEPLTVSRPRPSWSEQQPADWWRALDATLLRLRASHAPALTAVRAMGLSGQMHGAVCVDARDEVLRPAILWNDGRSAAQCGELESRWPALREVTGNLAMPGFTAPKLAWLAEHEPEVFERTDGVLLPKDWLRLQLCGERVSEMSDASGTLWLDVGARRWSEQALGACGMRTAQMPRLVEGSEVSGKLKADLASHWGLRAGIPIAGGGGDNAASAVGIGAVRPDRGFVSLGTSGVIFVCNDRFRPNPGRAVHAFCHALPGTWHQMSVMLSAASALRWMRTLLGLGDEAVLVERAAALTPAQRERAPIFLPYLHGERSPHNDPQAQGVLFGLTSEHDAGAVGYAVLEGIGFGLRDGWDSLQSPPGAVRSLSLVGGGARSGSWAAWLASILGVPLVTHHGGEAGGALGAARLAALCAGWHIDEVCVAPPVKSVFEPQRQDVALFAERHRRFRALYPALAEQFRR